MVRHELLQLVKNVPLCHSSAGGRSRSLLFTTRAGLYAPASPASRATKSNSKPHRSLIEIRGGERPWRSRDLAFLFLSLAGPAFFRREDFSGSFCSSSSGSRNRECREVSGKRVTTRRPPRVRKPSISLTNSSGIRFHSEARPPRCK